MMTLYQSWLARNKARESRIEDPVLIVRRAINLLDEWYNVQAPTAPIVPKPKERRFPPARCWIKVNADGAMAKHLDKGGGGVVVRDHDGRFLTGASHFSPSDGFGGHRVRACKRAMALIKELKLKRVITGSDGMSVVMNLTIKVKDRSMHGPLVEQIKQSLRELEDHLVKRARRTANDAAHVLAKEGCGLEFCKN